MTPEEKRLIGKIRALESAGAPFPDVLDACRALNDEMRRRIARDRLARTRCAPRGGAIMPEGDIVPAGTLLTPYTPKMAN